MIVKHVPMRSRKKSSFLGLVNYITDGQGSDARIGVTRMTNFESGTLTAAVAEALATQQLNTRATGDRTYHLLVSFRAGERPSKAVLNAIEDRIADALGFGGHQRVSAVHEDTEHLHIHVAINKIHPKRLTLHEPYQAYARLGKVCETLEREYGLQPDNHERSKRVAENRSNDIKAHRGVEPFLDWARRECMQPMRAAQTWEELHRELGSKAVKLSERGNGLILTSEQGERIKASSLGREFSRSRLEARLGPFSPLPDSAGGVSRGREVHRRGPAGFGVDTRELYARYQRVMVTREDQKREARALVTNWREQSIARERARNHARRSEIRSLPMDGVDRRALYSAESLRMREAIALVRERAASDLKIIVTRTRRVGWVDWLRAEAASGDELALRALRSRSGGDSVSALNTVGSEVTRSPVNFAVVQRVTKRGGLVMARGIRDEGQRLVVANDASSSSVRDALLIAARRFGPRLVVGGTPEFKAMVIRGAVDTRLPIELLDPALEQRRRALIARETEAMHEYAGRAGERPGVAIGPGAGGAGRATTAVESGGAGARASANASAAREQNANRIGREPPPESRHRLRELSALGMVRVGNGSAVLLPRDVRGDVEEQRSADADQLRRADAALTSRGAVSVGEAAAAKYMAERAEKRAHGLSIPEHVLYGADTKILKFAGIRTVDGERLALLDSGEKIMVLPITGKHATELKGLKLGTEVEVREGKVRRASESAEIRPTLPRKR